MTIIQRLRSAAGLPVAVSALLAFGAVSGHAFEPAATPVAGERAAGQPGSLSGAHLEGRRLTVAANCVRDGRVEARVAGLGRVASTVNCHRGRTRADLHLPASARDLESRKVIVVVRTGNRPTRSLLSFHRRPGSPAARSAQWSSAHANALCTTHPTVIDIGLAHGATFGLAYGTSFAWETWIYYVNARTGARGYLRYGALVYSYAGAYPAPYQRWYPTPGYWIQPMIHVTAPGISLFDSVSVNGGFPYPARTSQWCMW